MAPRPKRTRGASTRSAAATAPIAQEEPNPAPLSVPAVQRDSSQSTDIYDVSDREQRQGRRSTRSTAAATKSHVTTASASNPRQAAALNSQRKNRDSAMQRLENITSTATGTTNTTEVEGDSEDSAEIEMGRRADTTPARAVGGGRRTADFSGLDLDDSMFDDLNTTINTIGPASAQRSLDTSTLTASHFKRRPRGNSFLSRNDGPIRPSSRAGPNTPAFASTFDITNFKRRAREPSILGTAQKERPQRPEPESDSGEKTDDEDELEDELELELDVELDVEVEEQLTAEGFAPEAESTTPPRRSSRRSAAVAQAQESPSCVSPSVNPRKRKSTELHEHRPRSSPFADNPLAAEDSESESLSQPPSLPPLDIRPSTPSREEEEVAPPLSSSSEEEAEIWPPLKSLAKGRTRRAPSVQRRTPVRDIGGDNLSDMSSPPSLTYSPNYDKPSPPPKPAVKTRTAAKKEAKLTTADLTGLLPRRRHRATRADPFAVDESEEEAVDATGLGNDDDELYHLEGRSTRRRPAQPLSRAGNKNAKGAAAATATQRKGKQAVAPTSKRQTRRRTYGRNSDKENEGEDQEVNDNENGNENADPFRDEDTTENSDELVGRVGVELKNASRKFAEVDKWELAYETMTQSSSPHGGR
ncbi:hypothetical protein PG999_013884 [Apiospora kogelbergensis]|uniref:Uncharacterized protein n=1 Tax=Apiospora kogelbergensis TaxID=1337665 RepID=A0AAW0QGJ2_9PEZI